MKELPPQFDPAAIETRIYQRWIDAGVFTANNTSEREPYVIVIPPPNVTDVLHMGHGLNNALQDAIIRFERMRGRETCWLPGTDHAGIATQSVVERALAKEDISRHDLGREAFVERVWEHVHRTGGTILDQLKAIGSSCDWSRTRFTLDEAYSSAVRRVFVQLYEEGLIYRDYRVIHWDPVTLTALSDEEAEPKTVDGNLYHIAYHLADSDETVTVATTRPETMFGDVCLVFHPEDERYQSFKGREAIIPLTDIRIPIDTSEVVETDFGTGMLKVTPAHDANDFDIANASSLELDRPIIMTEDARMADLDRVPAELRGLDRYDARKRLVKLLKASGDLTHIEPHQHAVRHSYRSGAAVEPRLSEQWFVRMQPLAEPALQAYRDGKIRFVPDRWGKVYENWLTNIRDWNISRQLWWGHRIPAWYKPDGTIIVSATPPDPNDHGGTLVQDEDVLDTWFSSWLWPFATFGWPEDTADLKRFYPGHTLVTGPDIIFFWVARMIMSGFHFLGETPFTTVYMNGIVRDTNHEKMSKSKGNGINPLDVVAQYGADALRMTSILGAATGSDVILDPHDLDTSFAVGRNFSNKVWNVGRFILSNLGDQPSNIASIDHASLELADRWILARAQVAVQSCTAQMSDFRLSEGANTVYHFFWDELADWYVEQVKPRLYGDQPGGDIARAILLETFQTALRLLHPFMPFVSEELWSHLPLRDDTMLASASWPEPKDEWLDQEAERKFGLVQALVTAVRSIRSEYRIAPGTNVNVCVQPSNQNALGAFQSEDQTIKRLGKIADLSFESFDGIGAHAVLPDGSSVVVPLGDTIDVAKECERLSNEADRFDKLLVAVQAKLSNEHFVSRAPAEVVAKEREKEQGWREQRDILAEKLRALGC